jgi:hypothetical protein
MFWRLHFDARTYGPGHRTTTQVGVSEDVITVTVKRYTPNIQLALHTETWQRHCSKATSHTHYARVFWRIVVILYVAILFVENVITSTTIFDHAVKIGSMQKMTTDSFYSISHEICNTFSLKRDRPTAPRMSTKIRGMHRIKTFLYDKVWRHRKKIKD